MVRRITVWLFQLTVMWGIQMHLGVTWVGEQRERSVPGRLNRDGVGNSNHQGERSIGQKIPAFAKLQRETGNPVRIILISILLYLRLNIVFLCSVLMCRMNLNPISGGSLNIPFRGGGWWNFALHLISQRLQIAEHWNFVRICTKIICIGISRHNVLKWSNYAIMQS